MNLFKKLADEYTFRRRANRLHHEALSALEARYKQVPRVDSLHKVVISFTTTPERIAHLDVMLKSLLDQSVRVDAIYLCIPEVSRLKPHRYEIPHWLANCPFVQIIGTEVDLGPATKFVPTWQREKENPDTRIIIVDDDGLYPRNMVKTLIQWSDRLPQAAVGCSGMVVPWGWLPSDVLRNGSEWVQSLRVTPKSASMPTKVDYLFGYAGVLFRQKFFNESVLAYKEAPAGAFFEDDLWLSGHLHRSHIDRFVIPSPQEKLMPAACRKTLDTRALCETDNKDGRNMDEVYQYLFKPERIS